MDIGEALSETRLELCASVDSEDVSEVVICSAERVCFVDGETEAVSRRCTGDAARKLDNGTIVVLGRCDQQVKRAAKRVNLMHIEKVCYTGTPFKYFRSFMHHFLFNTWDNP